MIELAATKIIEATVQIAKDILGKRLEEKNERLRASYGSKIDAELKINTATSGRKLQNHVAGIRKWCASTSFFDLKQRKSLSDVYIGLDTYLMPLKTHLSESEQQHRVTLNEAILGTNENWIILGQPGAGKTTTIQRICQDYFRRGRVLQNHNFPIVVKMREFVGNTNEHPLLIALGDIVGLHMKFSPGNVDRSGGSDEKALAAIQGAIHEVSSDVIIACIDNLNVALLVDGLDEISDADTKARAVADVRALSSRLTASRLLLTCRSGDYNYDIENTAKFEIAPLSDEQISEIAGKWLKTEQDSSRFLYQIRNSPFADVSMRPLTIAHLLAIFERLGNIPDEPRSIYRKVVNLLLEEWDSQRSVRRSTKYANFSTDLKFEFLCALAYQLTAVNGELQFDDSTLVSGYRTLAPRFGLPLDQAIPVARELESHTGLFIEGGYRKYSFAHKSIQEYLTAEYLVRLPSLQPIANDLLRLSSELAVAVTLSSHADEYFSELVLKWLLPLSPSASFYRAFSNRLLVEKPNFSSSPRSVLAASIVLTHIGGNFGLAALFKPIMKSGYESVLFDHYNEHNSNKDHITYFSPRNRSGLKLPEFVTIPRDYA